MRTPVDGFVEVDGGELAVAVWPAEAGAPVLLALHGITASSREFTALAGVLPGTRVVAPDLRGRGRSNELPGPYGLRRHTEDLRRVLDVLHRPVVVLGHSMGGFPAMLLAAAEPERVAGVVLADGGLPLPLAGMRIEDLAALPPDALLGPAWERLTRVFASHEDYARFWQAHPAFAGAWTEEVAAYVDYDLEPAEGGFRPAANPEAVAADLPEQFGPDWYRSELARVRQPVTVLRAPLGLLAEPPGLYAPGVLEGFRALVPQLRIVEVPDVNHYTLVMTSPGVEHVAEAVREVRPRP